MNHQGTNEVLRMPTEHNRGWMWREPFVFQSSGEKCLLTSPFIEQVTAQLANDGKPELRSQHPFGAEEIRCVIGLFYIQPLRFSSSEGQLRLASVSAGQRKKFTFTITSCKQVDNRLEPRVYVADGTKAYSVYADFSSAAANEEYRDTSGAGWVQS